MIIARTKFFTKLALLLLLNAATTAFGSSYATRVDRTAAYLAQTKPIGAVALFGACVLAYEFKKQFEAKFNQMTIFSDPKAPANRVDPEEAGEIEELAIKTRDNSATSYLEMRAKIERERLERSLLRPLIVEVPPVRQDAAVDLLSSRDQALLSDQIRGEIATFAIEQRQHSGQQQAGYLNKVCTWGSRLWSAFTRP